MPASVLFAPEFAPFVSFADVLAQIGETLDRAETLFPPQAGSLPCGHRVVDAALRLRVATYRAERTGDCRDLLGQLEWERTYGREPRWARLCGHMLTCLREATPARRAA